jgi:tRNA pseudouridine55 synthase
MIMMQDGILLIDKPTGMTSFGVVARVRRVLSQQQGKKVKVGHTGTLDPFASGLMVLVVGKECKNAGHYSKLDKVYEATFYLGKTSTTGDTEGVLTEESGLIPSQREVEQALGHYTGEIEQTPPMFSAIKINGKRAYKLAQKGEVFTVPSRRVTVYALDLLEYDYPRVRVRAKVSSGTYIRTLAEDVGKTLGTGAYCEALRRESIAEYAIESAKGLSEMGIID